MQGRRAPKDAGLYAIQALLLLTRSEPTEPAGVRECGRLPANTIVNDALHLGKYARLDLARRLYSSHNDLPFAQLPQQHMLHSPDNAAS